MTALKSLFLVLGAAALVAAPLTAQKPTKPDADKPAKEAPAADTTSPIDEQIASENARHDARLKEIAKEEAAAAAGGKKDASKFQKARDEEVATHKQKLADLAAKKTAPKPSDEKMPGKGTDPTDKPNKPEKPGKPTDKPGKELPPTGKPTDRPGAEKPTDPTTDKPGKETPPGKSMNDPATGKPGADNPGKPGEKKVDKQGGGGKGELTDEQKAKVAEAIKNRDQELADLEAKYKADLEAARKKAEADGKPENFAKEEQILKARYEYQLKILVAKHEGLVKQAGG